MLVFVAGSALTGDRPGFETGGAEIAGWFDDNSGRIQVAVFLFALLGPLLVWFLATVASVAASAGSGARRGGAVAYGCGLVFLALFLADVTTLAVGALRPGNMAAAPELAAALQDFELLAMGSAAFVAAAVPAAGAVLALRHGAVWPRWVGWLGVVAAPLYALRAGTIFSADGAFAADGPLGLWVPVIALATWLFVASVVLARRLRTGS